MIIRIVHLSAIIVCMSAFFSPCSAMSRFFGNHSKRDSPSFKFLRVMGSRQRYCSCLVAFLTVFLTLLGFYNITMETIKQRTGKMALESQLPSSKFALIYAAPNYHMEVASTVSCYLSSIGLKVIAYVDNKISLHFNVLRPFSRNWMNDCISLYGQCVSEWVDISLLGYLRKDIPMEKSVSMIVFVTFPFKVRPWHSIISGAEPIEDPTAYNLLRLYFSPNRKKSSPSSLPKIVLVTHNVREMDLNSDYIRNIEKIVPRSYIHFLLLSDHTKVGALSKLQNSGSISVDYFFPIMPINFINSISEKDIKVTSDLLRKDNVNLATGSNSGPIFAIQGSFGGKSSFRRNLSRVMDCFSLLERTGDVSSSLQRLWPTTSANATNNIASNQKGVALQSSRVDSVKPMLKIDLIGRINQPFDWQLGRNLKQSSVEFHSDLPPREFYRAIHRAHYIIAAIDNREYFELRASSSIPAAFIAQVPVVATRELLNLYPCIRDMPIHRKLNVDESQCTSIKAALGLSVEDYLAAKQELLSCGSRLWGDSREIFRRIAELPIST